MSDTLLEALRALMKQKKSKAFYAERLGITETEVEQLLTELRSGNTTIYGEDAEYTVTATGLTRRENLEKGTLETTTESDFEPKSVEELVKLHKIDTTRYKVSSYWTKQRGDKFTSSLLCSLLKPTEFDPERFIDFLKTYKSNYTGYKGMDGVFTDEEMVDVEISLADFHIDKLDIGKETIEDRKEQYKYIIEGLTSKMKGYSINKIVFVIGNDFFQTDTYTNTTTKGTPVDHSTSWNNAYEEGFDLMVWAISFLKERCITLEVVLVGGNHDRSKSYYMAHALAVYFSDEKGIVFNREEGPIKHTMLGNTFVGYHHGDGKIDELPLIFATSHTSDKAFGNADYREVHTGDKHYYMVKEVKGVRIQQIPSLAGTDRWHRDSGFVNTVRAALALVYSPTTGKCGEFEQRIKNQ